MKNTLLAFTMVLAFGIGSDARADGPGPLGFGSFDGHIVFCAPPSDPISFEILPDGTQIIEFINIGNLWVTGNPLVDGVEENHVLATFEPGPPPPAPATGTLDINATVDVAAVQGGWRVRQFIHVTPEGDTGWGLGVGTGDLSGKLIVFTSTTPEEIANSPCAVPFGAPITGRVITFRWDL